VLNKKFMMIALFLVSLLAASSVSASEIYSDDAMNNTLSEIDSTDSISLTDDEKAISADDGNSVLNALENDDEISEQTTKPLLEKRNLTTWKNEISGNLKVNNNLHIKTEYIWGEARGNVTYTFITDFENTSVTRSLVDDFYYNQFWDPNTGEKYGFFSNSEIYTPKYFGNLIIKIDYSGDDNYFAEAQTFSYFINNTQYSIYLVNEYGWDFYSIDYKKDDTVYISTPHNFNGDLTITINGKKHTVKNDANREGKNYYLNASLFKYGENNYTISYEGDIIFGKFDSGPRSTRVESDFDYPDEIEYGDDLIISLVLPDDATGNVIVYQNEWDDDLDEYVPNIFEYETVKGAITNVSISNLPINKEFRLNMEYNGNYPDIDTIKYVTINPRVKIPDEIFVGKDSTTFNFKLSREYNGILTVTIDGEERKFDVQNGMATFELFNLVDEYPRIELDYQDNTNGYYFIHSYYPHVINVSRSYDFEVYVGGKKKTDFDGVFVGLNFNRYERGSVVLYVDGKKAEMHEVLYNETEYYYYAYPGEKVESYDVDGHINAYINCENLTAGEHSLECRYSGDDYFLPLNKTVTFNVLKNETPVPDKTNQNENNNNNTNTNQNENNNNNTNTNQNENNNNNTPENTTVSVNPAIKASPSSITYLTGKYYTVTVYGTDGKAAGNATVKITGKISKTLKTNANGIAKFKVTQKPGTYQITITALGKSITKKLTVKHLLTLKSMTVKKSAKKLVLQATLGKVNGKYLKGKTITFKFNGKTYKAQTNNKGIAKYTLKSSILKKLKVGKKVTYQATYSKDTVKKTVKVKK
jgi:hypothetical protein